eukprot:4215268-Amphidinium_carterae.2
MKHMAERQLRAVREVVKPAADTKSDNDALFSSLHPSVARVLAGKNLVLWELLLRRVGNEDVDLIKRVCSGFNLIGTADRSCVFEEDFVPAAVSEGDLKGRAQERNGAIVSRVRPSDESEVDVTLKRELLDEIAGGWHEGPFKSLEEVANAVGSDL